MYGGIDMDRIIETVNMLKNVNIEEIKKTAIQAKNSLSGLIEEILLGRGHFTKKKTIDKEILKYKKSKLVEDLESETKLKHSFYSFKGTIKKHSVECEEHRVILVYNNL